LHARADRRLHGGGDDRNQAHEAQAHDECRGRGRRPTRIPHGVALRQAAGDAPPGQEPPDHARHRARQCGDEQDHTEEGEERADRYDLHASRQLRGIDLEADPQRADAEQRDDQAGRGPPAERRDSGTRHVVDRGNG
jgi:hypothetical protein